MINPEGREQLLMIRVGNNGVNQLVKADGGDCPVTYNLYTDSYNPSRPLGGDADKPRAIIRVALEHSQSG